MSPKKLSEKTSVPLDRLVETSSLPPEQCLYSKIESSLHSSNSEKYFSFFAFLKYYHGYIEALQRRGLDEEEIVQQCGERISEGRHVGNMEILESTLKNPNISESEKKLYRLLLRAHDYYLDRLQERIDSLRAAGIDPSDTI